jgi:prepilin-type N-terminal cleavage/methylation domain-containing protein
MKWPDRSQNGLTLVELMVAMVLSLVLMAAVYMAYQVQHKSAGEQVKTASAQQDLRAAMNIIGTDFRLAGMAPFGRTNTGIVTDGTGHNVAGHSIKLSFDTATQLHNTLGVYNTSGIREVRYYLAGADPTGNAIRNYTLMREEKFIDSEKQRTDVGALVYNVSTFHLDYLTYIKGQPQKVSDNPGTGHDGVARDVDAIKLTLTVWANTSGASVRTERRLVRTISCRNMCSGD